MNEGKNNLTSIIIWGGVIIFIIWLLISSNNKQKPKYINEEFNNGKVINIPVDDSVTKDNWVCTGDCSGHDAGYKWAEDKRITDPSDCGGNSESFIEGCEAYANENSEDYDSY